MGQNKNAISRKGWLLPVLRIKTAPPPKSAADFKPEDYVPGPVGLLPMWEFDDPTQAMQMLLSAGIRPNNFDAVLILISGQFELALPVIICTAEQGRRFEKLGGCTYFPKVGKRAAPALALSTSWDSFRFISKLNEGGDFK